MIRATPNSQNTDGFKIAVVCASPLEAEMVQYLFDASWNHQDVNFRQARGDRNTYILGKIGKHNVVLVLLPGKGIPNAAFATAGLCASFSCVEIVIAVGRCGVVPQYTTVKTHDIFLGDCVFSTDIVQYDFGRQYPGAFMRKTGKEDMLANQNLKMKALVANMQTDTILRSISVKIALYLEDIQKLTSKAAYPGAHNDRLFDGSCLHAQHENSRTYETCADQASTYPKSCDVPSCGKIVRQRSVDGDIADSEYLPRLHFGSCGSGSFAVQSGTYRDQLAMDDKIIAFDMEGAGLLNNLPTIIIKSGCNYADGRESKEWQPYAAATAAAVLKAFLEIWLKYKLTS